MKYEGAGGLIVALVKTPIYPMLVSSPIACFVGALLTDITYWQTAEMMWANFSAWLITFGLILSGSPHWSLSSISYATAPFVR